MTDSEKKATHAVLYTDGGCRPASRGIGGWGLHGYLYRDEAAKQGASCPGAVPGKVGYEMGATGLPKITLCSYVDAFGSLLPESTNNQAEIMSVIKGLEVAKDHDLQHVTFVMDSQYAMQGMESWMQGWAKNNWTKADGQEIGNAELWRRCFTLKQELDQKGVTFDYRWVKGHSGELGNYLADRCATRGVFIGRNGHDREIMEITDAKGYWNYTPERSRMFSHPQWYFAAGAVESYQTEDGRHIYYLGDPREDEELLGKKIADATFSILYLRKPEPVLNLLRDTVARMGGDQYQALTIADLRTIFKPSVYREIAQHGDLLLNCDVKNHRITMWDHGERNQKDEPINSLLCRDVRPARLAYRAIEALQALEKVLREYLSPSPQTQLRTTDLTALLYESDTSKKKPVVKLKSHITSALRALDVEGANYATADGGTAQTRLRLTLSLDLPDRNTLAALAGDDTKVTLLTWPESEHAIRYAVVIESDGDIGIWSGIYSNLHLLTTKHQAL